MGCLAQANYTHLTFGDLEVPALNRSVRLSFKCVIFWVGKVSG